jgi:hypothetical protein
LESESESELESFSESSLEFLFKIFSFDFNTFSLFFCAFSFFNTFFDMLGLTFSNVGDLLKSFRNFCSILGSNIKGDDLDLEVNDIGEKEVTNSGESTDTGDEVLRLRCTNVYPSLSIIIDDNNKYIQYEKNKDKFSQLKNNFDTIFINEYKNYINVYEALSIKN